MSLLATTLAAAQHAAEAGEHAAEGGAHSEEAHKSETPFFVMGILLATFAVALSVFGFKRPDFPANQSAARGVMALSATLVLVTMFSIVYVTN